MRDRYLAVLAALALAVGLGGMAPGPAHAAGSCPDPTVSLIQVQADCEWTFVDFRALTSSATTHVWTTIKVCDVGSAARCDVFLSCTKDGVTAWMHRIFMDGIPVGQVCIPEDEEDVDVGALIIRQFKRIEWPASKLVVQPPGGKTLVNFKTNFFTPDNQAIDQSVKVANRSVEIRAVPTSYTFYFGDGTSTTTSQPGRPHPYLDITHEYAQTGSVTVSLDTTYSGEYRIGDGDWVAIPDTLTVEGEGQVLDILEALPQLVLQ